MKTLGGSVFLLLTASCLLWADEGELSVKAEVDKASFTVGDKIEYRVSAAYPPEVKLISAIPQPPEDFLELKKVHDFSEKEGNQIVEGRRFVFSIYQLGDFILEPVILKFRLPNGEEKELRTNRIFLTVESVDRSHQPKTDIRNIKGWLALPRSWRWIILLAGFLLTAALAFIVRARKKAPVPAEVPEARLSPEDRALLELNQLFDSDLLKRGQLKEYFLRFSEILKEYFERRFDIVAAESTTSELMRDLKTKEVPMALRQKIQQVLEMSDLAKFAKWKPALTELLEIQKRARQIIEEARPIDGV